MRIRHLSFTILVLMVIGVVFISGCVMQNASENIDDRGGVETTVEQTQGLKIVLKDLGLPEVKYLKPTIKEIQLQNEGGKWLTIWSDPDGKTVKLTPDGAEVVLDTVTVPAGTYVGTRLQVSTIVVEVDINKDGDTLDKDQTICLTEEEFNNLPLKLKPSTKSSAPEEPSELEAPTKPLKPVEDKPTGEEPGEESPEPEEPSAPEEPLEPEAPYDYKIIDGIGYYCTEILDEQHTVTLTGYMVPLNEEMWATNFVYDGNGGKIIFDFTLSPFEYKERQILLEVFITT